MKVAPLVGRRDYDGALRILEDELAGTTEDIPYLEMIAHCYWQGGKDEKAIETARKALVLDSNNFEMAMMLSRIYAAHEDHKQAIAYARMALTNYPSETLPTPPAWAFGALKLAGKFSAGWKRVEEVANEDLRDPEKARRDWRSWANEYLASHGENLKR